jgi:SnoaL-like polyketide cyclase
MTSSIAGYTPAVPDHTRRLFTQWLAMWNGDLAVAHEIIAPSLRVHLPVVGMPPPEKINDPTTMADWIAMFRSSYSTGTFACELGPFAVGDFIIARFRFTGTWLGGRPALATADAGAEVNFAGADFLRLEDGRIAEYWLTDDQLDLYAQVGAVPGL